MTPDPQAWSIYRPDALPELSPLADDEARVVAVTASDEAVSRGWACDVAIGLARGWSGSGLSVTLIDGDLVAPVLHEALGVENGTGLSDVLFFGSSFGGVSQDVEGGRFQFVTAGSPAAAPELAFQQERWARLCQQGRLTESTLLVFVPHNAPWSKAILDRATDIIVLAATNADVASELRLDPRVRAMLGVGAVDKEQDIQSAQDPLLDAGGEASPARVGTRSTARKRFVWGSAILLLIAVVLVQVMRGSGGGEATGPVNTASVSQPSTDAGPAPEQSAVQPEAIGPAARFTVTMSAYRDVAMATSRAEALVARASDHLVILVPIEEGGSVFHRLQAGVAPDSTTAAQISDELSQTLNQPSASWIIREAPLAFEVVRSPSLAVATERRDQVATRAIPAYVLGVEMSDGSVEYRVYVGAYADEGESSHMRSILSENGLADVALVPGEVGTEQDGAEEVARQNDEIQCAHRESCETPPARRG